MRRCPQCYEIYQGTGIFCENDGQRLLDVPGVVVAEEDLVPDRPARKSNSTPVAIGLGGVLIGVFLCGGAYVAYSLLTPSSETNDKTRSPLEAQMREPSQPQPAPARRIEAAPEPSVSPAEEEEPEAVASPEPAKPETETMAARLDRGPVSTGEPASASADKANVKTIIEMQDGSIVEVDAAWKDAQGVWYRRGGLVSFVEGPRVKAITARVEPRAAAAGNQ
jgi:hypothetical protein